MSAGALDLRARRPIRGPSAFGGDPRRFVNLTWTLAFTDFKLRFFGSALGYVWQLMRPLLLFGVLFLVFSRFFHFGNEARFYPVALLLGIVMFSFLSEATTASIRSLVAREGLIRKIEFPRLAVPLASVLTAVFNLALNLIPVLLFLLVVGGTVRWQWLELVPLIGLLTIFATGLAMLLSALFVRYRDVEPIWDVVLQILFYCSPILFTVQMVADRAGEAAGNLLMINPFAAVLQQARHAVVDPSHISAADAAGGTARLLVPLLVVVVTAIIGFIVFHRAAPSIAEEL
jgi:ABC-2 type transport system permease protein